MTHPTEPPRPRRFLWWIGQNYLRNIIKYSSLTNPLQSVIWNGTYLQYLQNFPLNKFFLHISHVLPIIILLTYLKYKQNAYCSFVLTLKAPITTAADDIFFIFLFFFYFSEKTSLGRQFTLNVKICFLWKLKKKILGCLSSATNFAWRFKG